MQLIKHNNCNACNLLTTLPYPLSCFLVINDHSLGTEIQLTIFSTQLDCVLIIRLILVDFSEPYERDFKITNVSLIFGLNILPPLDYPALFILGSFFKPVFEP